MGESDSSLLSRIGQSDRAAFTAFYDRHAPRIFGLLERMLGPGRETEDVLQETFLQVWRRAAAYEPTRGEPVPWLVMIARSRAIDHVRRNGRQVHVSEKVDDTLVDNGPSDLGHAEEVRQARQAMNSLPDDQRSAIQLAFFSGLTHEEIARRLGQPLGTVKTRIRLGMIKLRGMLMEGQ